MTARKPYPSDVSSEGWAIVVPLLALLPEAAGQRRHPLREVLDGLRYVVRTGAPWRWTPRDPPPRPAVHRQAQRWPRAGRFGALVHDLRTRLRLAAGRGPAPSAATLDSRTVQSSPGSGTRAGWDGAERRGSKVHTAVDTLGRLLALHATSAGEQDRSRVARLAWAAQEVTDGSVEPAYVDRAHTGEQAAGTHGIRPEAVKHTEPKRGFVLLPGRRVAERGFASTARFRRLARDHERLPETLAGPHFAAFAGLTLTHAARLDSP
jgi:transposase